MASGQQAGWPWACFAQRASPGSLAGGFLCLMEHVCHGAVPSLRRGPRAVLLCVTEGRVSFQMGSLKQDCKMVNRGFFQLKHQNRMLCPN